MKVQQAFLRLSAIAMAFKGSLKAIAWFFSQNLHTFREANE